MMLPCKTKSRSLPSDAALTLAYSLGSNEQTIKASRVFDTPLMSVCPRTFNRCMDLFTPNRKTQAEDVDDKVCTLLLNMNLTFQNENRFGCQKSHGIFISRREKRKLCWPLSWMISHFVVILFGFHKSILSTKVTFDLSIRTLFMTFSLFSY